MASDAKDPRMGQGRNFDRRMGQGGASPENTRDVPGRDYGAAGTFGDANNKSMADGYRGRLRPRKIPLLLAESTAPCCVSPGTQTYKIHMPLPATRVRARVEVMFVAADGQHYDLTAFGHTIDVLARVFASNLGAAGQPADVTEVSESAPGVPGIAPFPATARLMGYSKEFETAADEIYVEASLVPMAILGKWYANFRFEPAAGYGGSAAEWSELSQHCRPTREPGAAKSLCVTTPAPNLERIDQVTPFTLDPLVVDFSTPVQLVAAVVTAGGPFSGTWAPVLGSTSATWTFTPDNQWPNIEFGNVAFTDGCGNVVDYDFCINCS